MGNILLFEIKTKSGAPYLRKKLVNHRVDFSSLADAITFSVPTSSFLCKHKKHLE